MTGARPQSPGWYPDPDILPDRSRTLRYWDGTGWTERRRPVPVTGRLNLGPVAGLHQAQALEGPARAPELPAPAAEVSATREGPIARTDGLNRGAGTDQVGADLPVAPAGGQAQPPEPPRLGGGGGDGGGSSGSGSGESGGGGTGPAATGRPLRRKWWFVAAVAVVAATGVLVTAQAMRPPSFGPRVLTDSGFVQAANTECARTIPTLRPTDGGPLGSFTTPVQAADQIDRAAQGLDDLANRLAALPAADADRPHINAWLDGWHGYDNIGHMYASYLRAHGTPDKQPPFLAGAAQLARTVDAFAQANGLKGCAFTFIFVADPSQF